MTIQGTIDKLVEIRLTVGLAELCIKNDAAKLNNNPFADRFSVMADIECNNRKSNSLKCWCV